MIWYLKNGTYIHCIFILPIKVWLKGPFFSFDMMVLDMHHGCAAISNTSLKKVLYLCLYEKAQMSTLLNDQVNLSQMFYSFKNISRWFQHFAHLLSLNNLYFYWYNKVSFLFNPHPCSHPQGKENNARSLCYRNYDRLPNERYSNGFWRVRNVKCCIFVQICFSQLSEYVGFFLIL